MARFSKRIQELYELSKEQDKFLALLPDSLVQVQQTYEAVE